MRSTERGWVAQSRREVKSTEQEWGGGHKAGAGCGAQTRSGVRSPERERGGEHSTGMRWGA